MPPGHPPTSGGTSCCHTGHAPCPVSNKQTNKQKIGLSLKTKNKKTPLFALVRNCIQIQGAFECVVTLDVTFRKFHNLQNRDVRGLIKMLDFIAKRVFVLTTVPILSVLYMSTGNPEGKRPGQGHWGVCSESEQIGPDVSSACPLGPQL